MEKIKTIIIKRNLLTDCRKAWEMVTTDGLKASKLAGDGGSIVSRII